MNYFAVPATNFQRAERVIFIAIWLFRAGCELGTAFITLYDLCFDLYVRWRAEDLWWGLHISNHFYMAIYIHIYIHKYTVDTLFVRKIRGAPLIA